jgi:hypothetical protein
MSQYCYSTPAPVEYDLEKKSLLDIKPDGLKTKFLCPCGSHLAPRSSNFYTIHSKSKKHSKWWKNYQEEKHKEFNTTYESIEWDCADHLIAYYATKATELYWNEPDAPAPVPTGPRKKKEEPEVEVKITQFPTEEPEAEKKPFVLKEVKVCNDDELDFDILGDIDFEIDYDSDEEDEEIDPRSLKSYAPKTWQMQEENSWKRFGHGKKLYQSDEEFGKAVVEQFCVDLGLY